MRSDPAQAAFRIAVHLHPPGRLAIQRPGEHALHMTLGRRRRFHVDHLGMKAAMHEQLHAAAICALYPGRCPRQLGRSPFAQLGVELRQRAGQWAVHPHIAAGQGACQLQVVVAHDEHAATLIDERKHQPQRPGAVRAVIDQVAELQHEQVGFGSGGEGAGISVHVTHDAQSATRREAHGVGHAATLGNILNAAKASLRPTARSLIGCG